MTTLIHRIRSRGALGAALIATLVVSAVLLNPVSAAAPAVGAQLSPQQIGVNQAAQLSVTVQASQDATPSLPDVDGLQITPMGESSNYQSINGAVSASVTHLYEVTASQPGNYTIPSITVGSARTAALVLHVSAAVNGTAAAAPATGSLGSGGGQAPRVAPRAGNPSAAFLRVVLPKRQLYVGEVMPIQIKAYIPQSVDASLNGPPTLNSDAFTVSKLADNPQQSTQLVGRVPYTVLTWSSVLGAVKAGDYHFDLELPLTERITVPAADNDSTDSLQGFFGDADPFASMLGDADPSSMLRSMLGHVVQQPLTLKSDVNSLNVASLPSAGRPAEFSGAVGKFQVHSALTPDSGAAGDPLTLKLTVSGEGNFDRVFSSGLPGSSSWRVYRPQSQFAPISDSSVDGQKTFDQAVVPLRSGSVQLPGVTFSYFDPDARHYVTEHTQPIAIQVTPGAVAAVTTPGPSPGPVPAALAAAGGLFANKVGAGSARASLRPVLLQPWFAPAAASAMFLLGGWGWLVRWSEKRAQDPQQERNRTRAALVKANLALMDGAQRRGDAAEFFVSARNALQEQCGFAWHIAPGTVDAAQIRQHLAERAEPILALFERAEKAAYAQEVPLGEELTRWRQIVTQELAHWGEV